MLSMTGFGNAERSGSGNVVTVQISSYNRRQCDIRVHLPRDLHFLEAELRKYISARASRGMINIHVGCKSDTDATALSIDPSHARRCLDEIRELQNALGLAGEIQIADLLRLPALTHREASTADNDAIRSVIMDTLEHAFDNWMVMKAEEGAFLEKDIRGRVATINNLLQEIEQRAPDTAERARARFMKRLDELGLEPDLNDERVLKESAFIAERTDVSEECTRLHSHLGQMEQLLDSDAAEGRKLDFLVQEMGREINTIASKAGDADISQRVVDTKTELERIREQVQNIE